MSRSEMRLADDTGPELGERTGSGRGGFAAATATTAAESATTSATATTAATVSVQLRLRRFVAVQQLR